MCMSAQAALRQPSGRARRAATSRAAACRPAPARLARVDERRASRAGPATSPLMTSKNACWMRFGDRAAAAVADRDLVDRPDRRDLDGGADEERLVGDVEHLARQHLLAHREAEVARERDDRVARDARQDRGGQRRRVDDVVAHEEQVLAAAFAEVAVGVERDAFAVAFGDRFHLDQLRVGVVGRASSPASGRCSARRGSTS